MLSKQKHKIVKLGIFILALLVVLNIIYHIAANNENEAAQNTANKKPPSVPNAIQEKHVLADFYYWYDMPNGVHSTSLTDHPTDTASYKNPEWFKKQFLDMKEAGVDIALLVYWSKYEPAYTQGLQNMVQARDSLAENNKNIPKIGLFLDTGIFGRVPKSDKNLLSPEGKAYFYSLIKEFYSNIPKEDWGEIDGRPVVWLWGNYFNILFNQSSFDYVYSNFQKDFGTRPYIVREESWNYPLVKGIFIPQKPNFANPITTDDVYRWGAELNGMQTAGGNVASVGPGYDERQLKGSDRTARYTQRNFGQFYKDNLQKALDSGKNLINIETWDEFHEASDIADSQEYGKTYINLTKLYTAKFYAK